ncbi:MAG: feruloyl-CoA synthase, partial [Burkholderiales bacterium]|nr:feruloyl-CoA synthase [Burkholderiales bacterium]
MSQPQTTSPAPFRALRFGVKRVKLRDGAAGTHYLMAEQPLQPYPERMTDRFRHWAQTTPDATWVARRAPAPVAGGVSGDWRRVSYVEAWRTARAIAQGLINRGLSAERPVV